MLAYAADRRRLAERRSAPHAMLAIIALHVTAIAAVMSAKMDLPGKIKATITRIELIDPPAPPPPPEPRPQPPQQPRPTESVIDRVPPRVPTPPTAGPSVDPTPVPVPQPGPIGPSIDPLPQPVPQPLPTPAPPRTGPRFITPPSAVRPPYPSSKVEREEEAALKLRLSIDERGRVVAVDAVGRTDPVFLEAARRHLMAKWRYQPATENGRAVRSSTVITLRFELDD